MRIAISRIALWKTRRVAESRRIEEWMRLVDTGVDVADLNARAGSCPAASGSPGIRRVDDLIALAQNRVVKRVVLCALDHRGGCDCRQRRAVELHCHRVKRDIILARNLCPGCVFSQPPFQFVPSSVQLGAIRSHGIAVEINFSAVCRLGTGTRTQGITFELHNGTRVIHIRAAVEGVSICIWSRRSAAYAKCNNAQANSREYQDCSEYFFHRFCGLEFVTFA